MSKEVRAIGSIMVPGSGEFVEKTDRRGVTTTRRIPGSEEVVRPGEIGEFDDDYADHLISRGLAEPVDGEESEEESEDRVDAIATAIADLDDEDYKEDGTPKVAAVNAALKAMGKPKVGAAELEAVWSKLNEEDD